MDSIMAYNNNLTPREAEVVKLISDGLSNQEIADVLDLSYWTVAGHVKHIVSKLCVSRAQLVAPAREAPPDNLVYVETWRPWARRPLSGRM